MNTSELDEHWLGPLAEADPAALENLHDRLESAAARDSSLDIAYRTLDTPIGRLLLAATARGLLRVAFDCEGHDEVLSALAGRVSPRILRAPARLEPAASQLDAYFGGRRTDFELELDRSLSQGFRLSVLVHLQQIGYGRTESYGQVALAAGSPQAVRAVGSACATNPLPVVVPCHRVLRSDGALGGYLGGLEAKRTLLALEAGTPPRS